MAEAYLRMLLAAEGVVAECSSRGMYVWAWEPGASAAPLALELMASEGAHSITQHRAIQLTEDELRAADLAIVMTRAHREALEETPAAEGVDVRLLTSFVDGGAEDVPDPYFGRARTPAPLRLPATAAQARAGAPYPHRRSVSLGAPCAQGIEDYARCFEMMRPALHALAARLAAHQRTRHSDSDSGLLAAALRAPEN